MSVELQLALMFEGAAQNEVESVLKNFEELKRICTKDDLAALVMAIQSEFSNFWLRELLSEPITRIGGYDYLPILFDALEKGEIDGHDNDGFIFNLTEMVASSPSACRQKLEAIIGSPGHKHKKIAEWLIEYCTN